LLSVFENIFLRLDASMLGGSDEGVLSTLDVFLPSLITKHSSAFGGDG